MPKGNECHLVINIWEIKVEPISMNKKMQKQSGIRKSNM